MTDPIELPLEFGDVAKVVLSPRARGGFNVAIHDSDGDPLVMATLSRDEMCMLADAIRDLVQLTLADPEG